MREGQPNQTSAALRALLSLSLRGDVSLWQARESAVSDAAPLYHRITASPLAHLPRDAISV
jgi:hypothetical protein